MENKEKDMIDQIEEKKEISSKTSMSRRLFLKKTVYTAPSLVALGSLTQPAVAGGSTTDSRDADFDGGFGGNSFGG